MKKIISIILVSIIGISIIPKTLINEKHIVLESTTSVYTKEEVDSLLSTIRNNITNNTNEITNIKNELTTLKNSLSNYALKTSLNITNSNIDNLNSIVTDNTSRIEALEAKLNEEVSYICKRATTLHTEECTQTDSTYYCSGSGYTKNGSKGTTTITYGNEIVTKGVLTSGDAFTCDVNGDGEFDEETERFYYVSDLSSNTKYAVLVYYNNTTRGVADNTSASLITYESSNKNYQGPVTAITNLPTTTQWSNVSLSSTSRAITNESGGTTSNGGNNILPTAFRYEGYAARLLTVQEINSACRITVGSVTLGELDKCNYLMENTQYSNSIFGTYGYWLETPYAANSNYVWSVNGYNRLVNLSNANYANSYGNRPAIEVLKYEISY